MVIKVIPVPVIGGGHDISQIPTSQFSTEFKYRLCYFYRKGGKCIIFVDLFEDLLNRVT